MRSATVLAAVAPGASEDLWRLTLDHEAVHRFSTVFAASNVRDFLGDDEGIAEAGQTRRPGLEGNGSRHLPQHLSYRSQLLVEHKPKGRNSKTVSPSAPSLRAS